MFIKDLPNIEKSETKFFLFLIKFLGLIYILIAFGFDGVQSVTYFTRYIVALMLVGLLLNHHRFIWDKALLIYLFLYIYLAVQCISVPDKESAISAIKGMTTSFLGTISVCVALRNGILSYRMIILAAIIACCINIVAVLMGIDTYPGQMDIALSGRAAGLNANANYLAIAMVMAGMLIWFRSELFSIYELILGIVIGAYGVYVSASRKGFILFCLFLFLFLIVFFHDYKKNKILCFIVILMIAFGVYHMANNVPFYLNKIKVIDRITNGTFKYGYRINDPRVNLFWKGLEAWQERPFLGYGLFQFRYITNERWYSHNNFIELLVSGGIVAFLLYYSLHAFIGLMLYRLDKFSRFKGFLLLFSLLFIDTVTVSFTERISNLILVILLIYSVPLNKIQTIHNVFLDPNYKVNFISSPA